MAEISLQESREYQIIRESRNLVRQITGMPDNFGAVAGDLVFSVFDRMRRSPSPAELSRDGEREMNEKRGSTMCIVLRQETVAPAILDFNSELSKNMYRIFAVSNFAFVEYIFWIECDYSELKKYRSPRSGESQSERNARGLRSAGEEAYKSGQIEEALKNFHASLKDFDSDFTVHYQLGLIYFFEKADCDMAVECFRNASRYSQGRSTQVFIHSMVMHGLIMRITATMTGKKELLAEAYQATSQGYQVDTTYFFSKYAFAQCAMNAPGRVDPVGEAVGLLKELIGREKMFMAQAVYDRAFDKFLTDVDTLVSNMYLESVNISLEVFKVIEDLLEYLGKYSHYSKTPDRCSEFRIEFKNLVEQFNRKDYFDVVLVRNRLNVLFDEIRKIVKEIERNKTFFEVKEYLVDLLAKYDAEMREAAGGADAFEEEYDSICRAAEEMKKNFPEPAPGKAAWYEGGSMTFIKILSGCFVFMLILLALILYSLIFENGVSSLTASLGFINLVFLPVYGSIAGELYYAYIENKRRAMAKAVQKQARILETEKNRVAENEKRLREIYMKMIMDRLKVSRGKAEDVFEAAVRENFERVKNLMAEK